MHLLLGLLSLLAVVLGGYLALGILRRLDDWSRRRDLQLLVLAAPVASLAAGIAGVLHFAGRTCFLGAPPGMSGSVRPCPSAWGWSRSAGWGWGWCGWR